MSTINTEDSQIMPSYTRLDRFSKMLILGCSESGDKGGNNTNGIILVLCATKKETLHI